MGVSILLAALLPQATQAQADATEAPVVRESAIGDTRQALPGINRIGIASEGPRGLSAAASAGYGITESVLGESDSHHRIAGSLAISARLFPWFATGLTFDGRYDKHSDVPSEGADQGYVGDPRIYVRVGRELKPGILLGAQAGIWFPGNRFPSVILDALSVDLEALAGYRLAALSGTLTFASRIGYRLDRSPESAEALERYSRSDRLALGLSDFDAVLLGLGAVWQRELWEVLFEGTLDMLVGSSAPAFAQSPMRASAGVRYRFGPTSPFRVQVLIEGVFSKRPVVDLGEPLVPVEPRFAALVGLNYRFSWEEPKQQSVVSTSTEPPPEYVQPAGRSMLQGHVLSEDGEPLKGGLIYLKGPAARKVRTDESGNFVIDSLRAGTYTLVLQAPGYQSVTRRVELEEEENKDLTLQMMRIAPKGLLRGIVRSFNGDAVFATVKILPLGVEIKTDDGGSFEVDIVPGEYEVIIRAVGFEEQRRKVRIENKGVTLLNIDLRRSR